MYCTSCGKANPDEANFCYSCGASLSIIPSPDKADVLNDQTTEESPEVVSSFDTAPKTPEEKKDHKKGLAIAGLVFSCVGLGISVLCCFYFGSMLLGIPLCVAGITMCSVSLKSKSATTIAVTGLIIGIVGTIIGLLMMIFLLSVLALDGAIAAFFNQIIDEFLYH